MKQTGKVFGLIAILFLVFFIFGCSDLKNPVEADNTNFEGQENPMLLKGKKGPKGSQASNHIARNAVDDIKLSGDGNEPTVYEDGRSDPDPNTRWFIEPPDGEAFLASVYDTERVSDVIELFDNNTNSTFVLGNGEGSTMWSSEWNNTTQFTIEWSLKFNVSFAVYVLVETDDGYKFLYYTPIEEDLGYLAWGNGYVHHGLGSNAADGTWRSFTRNLQDDLNDGIPGLEINAVIFFKIRGLDDYMPPAPFCEDGQKPRVLTMEYTGESCDASNHSQDPGKVSCWGDPNFAPLVRIRVTDKEQPFHHKTKVFYDDQVALGAKFNIDARNVGEDKLKANTYVSIFDLQDNLLQTIMFHTSCSQPLIIGEQFGSLILTGGEMTDKKGPKDPKGPKGK